MFGNNASVLVLWSPRTYGVQSVVPMATVVLRYPFLRPTSGAEFTKSLSIRAVVALLRATPPTFFAPIRLRTGLRPCSIALDLCCIHLLE